MNPKIAKDLATGIGRVIDDTRVAVRQAEVTSVDTSAGVKVGIDVDGVQVDDVPCFNNVVPSVGDSAWVMTLRSGRWVVIGHTNAHPVSGGGGASVVVSDTEPASPGIGDLWFESDTGRTFLYYNDGSSYQWVEIGGNFGTFTGATPSGVDGSIQFALSGGLSSDASNLFWDDANNRLGIGNNSPAHSVDVTGSGRFTSNLTIGAITLPSTDGSASQVLVTDGAGNVSWADQSGGGGASVTVSDTAPSSPSAGDLWFESDTGKTFVYYDDGTSTQWVEVGAASAAASGTDGSIQFSSGGAFASDASNLYWDDTNNRLGVGTNSPTYPLEVDGAIQAERYRGENALVLNDYTTANPSSNVYLYSPPNDRDAWIYLDSAATTSNWGIYHRQIDSTVGDVPSNSVAFVGGGSSAANAYIRLTNGNIWSRGNVESDHLNVGSGTGLGDSGEDIRAGGIRGTFTSAKAGNSQLIHLYNNVNIGYPTGWGGQDAPQYGLHVYGAITTSTHPMFVARSDVNNQEPTSTTKINYTATTANRGNHYNTSTSTFTAPLDGVYEFNLRWWYKSFTTGTAYVYLYVNNAVYGEYRKPRPTALADYEQCYVSWKVALSANDSVHIRANGTSNQTFHSSSTNRYSEFSGMLLG